MRRLALTLTLWWLASCCQADALADALRACVDAGIERHTVERDAWLAATLDKRGTLAPSRGEAMDSKLGAEADADAPESRLSKSASAEVGDDAISISKRPGRFGLARDCPEAMALLPHPMADGMGLSERRLRPVAWRDIADTLEQAEAERGATGEVGDPGAVLVALAPAPLDNVNLRPLWRERLDAWVGRQFRRLFGPDTGIGRWLRDLGPDDLSGFANGLLIAVLVLLTLLLALCGLLLYRFVTRRGGRRRTQVELPAALAEVPLLEIEQIRALPEQSQALALMRLVLARIEEAGLCRTSSAMTNSEIAQLLALEAGVHIDRLAALADRCLFGGQSARPEDLPPCFAEMAALEARAA